MSSERQSDLGPQGPRGGAFYDRPGVLERYRLRNPETSSPNLVMEEPAFQDELGNVDGLRVLDLGCGDASLGLDLLERGCSRYLGIDGSERMLSEARAALRGTRGEVMRCDIEDFTAPSDTFDLVVSRLALHYVADIDAVLTSCRICLSSHGRILLTVVHPVITCHDSRSSTEELRTNWTVDEYFLEGPREQRWLGDEVTWYHRTIDTYTGSLRQAGFALTAVRECVPRRDRFADEAEFVRRRRIPMFLLLSGSVA